MKTDKSLSDHENKKNGSLLKKTAVKLISNSFDSKLP